MVYYINFFSYVEPTLYFWNKLNLIMLDFPFYTSSFYSSLIWFAIILLKIFAAMFVNEIVL